MSDSDVSFSSVNLYQQGWGLLKQVWKPLLKVMLVWIIIEILAQASLDYVQELSNVSLQLLISGVSLFLSVILQSGFTAVSLKLVREKTAEVNDLFAQKSVWLNYFLGLLAYQFLVGLGFILLIIPGIYWALKYSQVLYLVVDKKVGVSEAFNMSGKMTRGLLWKILGFWLVAVLVNLAGLLALGVGLIVTMGITVLAYVLLYEQLLVRVNSNQPAAVSAPVQPAEQNPEPPVTPPTIKV